MLVTFYHLTNPTLWQFWANFKTSPLQSSPFRRIKKINLTLKLQLQSLHFSIPAIHVLLLKYFNESKNFVLVPSVLESSLPLCGRPNILLVNWWQLMTNVSVCTDSGMTGQVGSFQNTVVYLQAFPYLSSPLPSHSFSHAIFCVVFDSHSSFFALKPHGNACYLYGGKFIIYKYDEVNLGCKFITYKSWSFTLPSVNLLFVNTVFCHISL